MSYLDALCAAVLVAAAAYRIWRFLAVDTLTFRPRCWLFFRDPRNGTYRRGAKYLYYMWRCPWCLGAWVTIALTIAVDRLSDGGLPVPALVAAAASAGTGLLGANDPDALT